MRGAPRPAKEGAESGEALHGLIQPMQELLCQGDLASRAILNRSSMVSSTWDVIRLPAVAVGVMQLVPFMLNLWIHNDAIYPHLSSALVQTDCSSDVFLRL